MTITITGKEAVIKQNSSFDIISENRNFSGADSYSLTITFPLKDCQKNLAIFGHINRKDVEKTQMVFPCTIRSGKFFKSGSITIIEITDIEVKTQFLEGQSVSNYLNNFDNIYINELDLGYPETANSAFPISNFSGGNNGTYLALPWVNNNTGNVQNDMNLSLYGATWASAQLSYQPFMKYLVELMCTKLGYTCSFAEWENSDYKYLLCCNALPAAWGLKDFGAALPHWTITELLDQLELLMNCEFTVDHIHKNVSMQFTKNVINSGGEVELTQVLDDYQMETMDATDCKYRGLTNLKYADCDHRMWKYYVNPEFLKFWLGRYKDNGSSFYREVESYTDVVYKAQTEGWRKVDQADIIKPQYSRLYYCKGENRYLIVRAIKYNKTSETWVDGEGYIPDGWYNTAGQFINTFEPRIVNEEMETKELKIVPVWIDFTTPAKGQTIFLQLPDYGCEKSVGKYNGFANWDEAMAHMSPEADYFIKELQNGEESKESEYLDKIYVGFFPGELPYEEYPHPEIDYVSFDCWWFTHYGGWSLSLKSDFFNKYTPPVQIDPTKKFTFKFLADDVPNVRAIFNINGKRYVCEKITATFNASSGMSKLQKGVFYLLKSS